MTVRAIEDLSPRMRRITFHGDSLEGFGPPKPGSHIKLFFGDLPPDWQPVPGQPRPTSRTYTPRHFDPVRRELVVDFVRHGEGVASEWAEQARIGSPLMIAGPGGGQVFPEDLRHLVLLADESALPAVGTILDSLPPHCLVTLLAEVEDASDQRKPSATGRNRRALAGSIDLAGRTGQLVAAGGEGPQPARGRDGLGRLRSRAPCARSATCC